jgi:hypothetical protein
MGGWGWSWLGCCSFWFRYLSRSSLKLYKLLCNGHSFPPIGQVRLTFTPSFGSTYEGRFYIHGRVGLVFVGLLQPLVPLFVQIFPRTVEVMMLRPQLPAQWASKIDIDTILWKYVWRKIPYTWESGADLGWVVAASSSFICPDLHSNYINYYVMATTSRSSGK